MASLARFTDAPLAVTTLYESSAGIIPFQIHEHQQVSYLILHSALVRNPKARWEFPKGTIEAGEIPPETAAREFLEETGITAWTMIEGFEQSLGYAYLRRGQRINKTVTYYLGQVFDDSMITQSCEHMKNEFGHWYTWGSFARITQMLYHPKIRHLFADADAFVRRSLERGSVKRS